MYRLTAREARGSAASDDIQNVLYGRQTALRSVRHLFLLRARRNRNIWMGGVGILIMALSILAGPVLLRDKPYDVTDASLASPSEAHPFGTDHFGRDVLSRVVSGGRLTIGAACLAVALGMIPGTAIGVISALAGYRTDLLIMRGIDILMAFPSILLALIVVAIRGPGLINAMIAVGVSLAPTYVRVVRGVVLSIREKPYIEAAQAIGCGFVRIAQRHVLPNIVPTILVVSTVAIGWAILLGSSLSFLGLGPQPPTSEWGVDLADGHNYLEVAWWISTFPGVAIMIATLSINLLGDGLRDLLDPHMRGAE
jgi:peptide/nickel transport system permease protein